MPALSDPASCAPQSIHDDDEQQRTRSCCVGAHTHAAARSPFASSSMSLSEPSPQACAAGAQSRYPPLLATPGLSRLALPRLRSRTRAPRIKHARRGHPVRVCDGPIWIRWTRSRVSRSLPRRRSSATSAPPPHPPQKTPPLSGPVCDRQAPPHTPASPTLRHRLCPCTSDQVIDESEKNVQEPKLAREQRGSRGLKV